MNPVKENTFVITNYSKADKVIQLTNDHNASSLYKIKGILILKENKRKLFTSGNTYSK